MTGAALPPGPGRSLTRTSTTGRPRVVAGTRNTGSPRGSPEAPTAGDRGTSSSTGSSRAPGRTGRRHGQGLATRARKVPAAPPGPRSRRAGPARRMPGGRWCHAGTRSVPRDGTGDRHAAGRVARRRIRSAPAGTALQPSARPVERARCVRAGHGLRFSRPSPGRRGQRCAGRPEVGAYVRQTPAGRGIGVDGLAWGLGDPGLGGAGGR